jgi:transposase
VAKIKKKTVKRVRPPIKERVAKSNAFVDALREQMPKEVLEPVKKPFGRPTKYEPEFCEEVVDFMAKGYSKEAVAGHLQIDSDTLKEWNKKYPDFSTALKQGVELSRKFWEATAINHITHTAKGTQLNSTAWIFNMKNRFNWTDKKEVELGEQTRKGFGFKLDISPDMLDETPDAIEE